MEPSAQARRLGEAPARHNDGSGANSRVKPGRGLGDGGTLFDWYFDGEVPSQELDAFSLSEPSARVFDALARRVGASLAGRNTYEDSDGFGGGGPHPTARSSSSATGRRRR
jgi:hypothetical protein